MCQRFGGDPSGRSKGLRQRMNGYVNSEGSKLAHHCYERAQRVKATFFIDPRSWKLDWNISCGV